VPGCSQENFVDQQAAKKGLLLGLSQDEVGKGLG
jgi:hypothetical protein